METTTVKWFLLDKVEHWSDKLFQQLRMFPPVNFYYKKAHLKGSSYAI